MVLVKVIELPWNEILVMSTQVFELLTLLKMHHDLQSFNKNSLQKSIRMLVFRCKLVLVKSHSRILSMISCILLKNSEKIWVWRCFWYFYNGTHFYYLDIFSSFTIHCDSLRVWCNSENCILFLLNYLHWNNQVEKSTFNIWQ